jgi:Domain of unknown function (DUF3883)
MTLTTQELADATAGGDDYIRTLNNQVKGLALRLDLNPEAPEIIAFGDGPRIVSRAKLLLASAMAVPTYVKRDVNEWEYLGEYRATAIRWDAQTIEKYSANREGEKIAGVLFLESAAEPKVQVTAGGYADAETRREIELAAIEIVTRELKLRNFMVHDRQRENRGYDLLAVSEQETLMVEVKGTDSLHPRFFLTRNEWNCAKAQPDWRLFVVCQARGTPKLHEYTQMDIGNLFLMEPLAWECTQE